MQLEHAMLIEAEQTSRDMRYPDKMGEMRGIMHFDNIRI